MTAIQTLSEVKRLAFMGEFDAAIKLTSNLPPIVGLKAHLLIIELENNSKRDSGAILENHED